MVKTTNQLWLNVLRLSQAVIFSFIVRRKGFIDECVMDIGVLVGFMKIGLFLYIHTTYIWINIMGKTVNILWGV